MQAPIKEKRELDDKLITACREGDMAKVLRLMEAGADVNAVGPLNRTPLMTAALFGHTEICLHLFDHGAKLDTQVPNFIFNIEIINELALYICYFYFEVLIIY